MRHLLTGVGLALALAIASTPNGFAQSPENEFDAADRFTNRDLLEKSDRDQRLWLSGVAMGVSHGLGLTNTEAASCLIRWYFDDPAQVFANMRANMERFPDHEPSILLIALARRECPSIDMVADAGG